MLHLSSIAKSLRAAIYAVLLVGALGITLHAQTTATISGVVTDASGASVAGAKVDVKNIETGALRSAISDAQGRYTAPELQIGEYEVQATMSGFQTVVHKGITLNVGGQSVVDFSLPVGQTQQTLTVEAQASQVETTSSSVSSLVNQSQIRDLPLNGRNIESLILLAPGVSQSNTNGSTAFYGRSQNYSIAGSRGEGQAFMLDNQDLANFYGHSTGASATGSSLGVDAIAEFQTLTATYSAQFGGNGAAVNAASKSGTNSFHGSAFEFLRNSALDARKFIDPAAVPAFRKNQFGASLGGRVKKDKAFFFVNYEGIQQILNESNQATVPDLGNRKVTATNPSAVAFINQVLALYPAPTRNIRNVTGAGLLGDLTSVAKQVVSENYILARFDYNLTDKDTVFVRYISDRASFDEPFDGSAIPLFSALSLNRNQFATIEERRIITANIVNSLHFSMSRPVSTARPSTCVPVLDLYSYGAGTTPSCNGGFTSTGRQDGTLAITGGITTIGSGSLSNFNQIANRWPVGDDVLWTRGAHSLKLGITVQKNGSNTYNPFRYGGGWTFSSYSNFLAGIPSQFTGALPGPQFANRDIRETEIIPYVHDEWKISSRLTLNLGVRYNFITMPTDKHNALWSVPSFAAKTSAPFSSTAANCSTGLNANDAAFNCFTHTSSPFVKGNPATMNFDPRVGIAYDPFANHKTSIRAGFGLFHDPIQAKSYLPFYWAAPPITEGQTTYNQNSTQATYCPGAFPVAFICTAGGTLKPPPFSATPGWDPNNTGTPYMMQWNLTIQREIGNGTVLSVGYVGSHGVHLMTPIEQNPPCNSTLGQPCSVAGFGQVGASGTNLTVTPNVRLNAAFAAQANAVSTGTSSYNSLQIGVNRRLTNNLQAQLSYTWAHSLDNGSITYTLEGNNSGGQQSNPYNYHNDWATSGFDIQHTFRLNALYTLPFRANRLVSGWQFSGITSVTTGPPFSVNGVTTWSGLGVSRPNAVAGCDPTAVPGGQNSGHWYNAACYTLQAPGTIGNLGRDTVRAPGLVDTDIALLKNTRLRENLNLQFRAEAFNLFNHTNLSWPGNGNTGNVALVGPTVAQGPNATVLNTAAGQISNINGTPRQIQFGLKLIF